jgi:5-methylcytosine-specific restriction endonuclease McrA
VENKVNYKLKAFIISRLRRASFGWPGRSLAVKAARLDRGQYECAECRRQNKTKIWGYKEISVDHITPVIDPTIGFVDWNTYIPRMFPEQDGWQVLCDIHHDNKTKDENKQRKTKTAKKQKTKRKVKK